MTHAYNPPFFPPYTIRLNSDQGIEKWVEVQVDGTEISVQPQSLKFSSDIEVGVARPDSPAIPNISKIVFLNVPYAQKEKAKLLGAKWDANKRKWYVPIGIEVAPFISWLPPSD